MTASTDLANAAANLVEDHTIHIADPRTEERYADKIWHYAPTVGKVQHDGAVSFGIVCNAILDKDEALKMIRAFRLDLIKAVDRNCRDRRRGKIVFNRSGYWHMGRFCTTGWSFTLEPKISTK